MPTCILHVGMPKTGTTSIQESLYFGLEDPAYRYISLGHVNAVVALEPVFADRPEEFWEFRSKGLSKATLRALGRRYGARLQRALRRAKSEGRTPIISTERLWHADRAYLERLRDFLRAEGFDVRVIAYVRPIKSWTESNFQTLAKWRIGRFDRLGDWPTAYLSRWSGQLARLESVFGRRALTVRPFGGDALAEGCAVADFCRTAGVRFDARAVIRSNESVSIDAVRCLYAYNRFVPAESQPGFVPRILLVMHLERLAGPPFRLHSSLFAPMAHQISSQQCAIRDRFGVDISEDIEAADGGPCVRDETDLLRYSRQSLDWLADASQSRPIMECEGESAGREVALQMDRIRRKPSMPMLARLAKSKLRRECRWIRHGD